jgi:hypothetical protein
MEDFIRFIGFAVATVISTVAAVWLLVALFMVSMDWPTCNAKARRIGMQSDWGLFQGCMVRADGQWVTMDVYEKRVVEENVSVRIK